MRAASYEFPPASEEDPRLETAGLDSHHAPEAWCCRKKTLKAQRAVDWCSQRGTLHTQLFIEATDGLVPSGFDHMSGAVRADSCVFSSTIEADPMRDIAGSDSRRAPEAWCPRTGTLQAEIPTRLLTLLLNFQQHIGRSVHNFDSAVGDRKKENGVLSGTYAKFTQDSAMKNIVLSSDNKILAEASPLNPVRAIGLRADDPTANNPCQWRGKKIARLSTFCRSRSSLRQ